MSDYTGFAGQLDIETPEQVELRFPVAGIGSRCLAILTDTCIQILAELLLVLLFILLISSGQRAAFMEMSDTASKWVAAIFILIHFLLFWGYFSLFEALHNGQTPGKQLLKIRVIKDSGRQITFFEALARNLLRVVDMVPGLYFVGLISMMFNQRQQRLGDLVAGTIVVHERTEEQPLLSQGHRIITASVYTPPAPDPLHRPNDIELPADAVARLSGDDLNVIETFFSRALDLDLAMRAEMASRICTRMFSRMQISVPDAMPEDLLDAIAHTLRTQRRP